jgi:hypothetical protein
MKAEEPMWGGANEGSHSMLDSHFSRAYGPIVKKDRLQTPLPTIC